MYFDADVDIDDILTLLNRGTIFGIAGEILRRKKSDNDTAKELTNLKEFIEVIIEGNKEDLKDMKKLLDSSIPSELVLSIWGDFQFEYRGIVCPNVDEKADVDEKPLQDIGELENSNKS